MKKGYVLNIAGSFKVVQKQNANGYTKYTIKLEASEVELEDNLLKVDAEQNNSGEMRLFLLKYTYVHQDNEEKVNTSLRLDDISKEVKSMLMDACKYM